MKADRRKIERRELLTTGGRLALGAGAAAAVGGLLAPDPADARGYRLVKEASWYRKGAGGAAVCMLCPFFCLIGQGKRGACRTRFNAGGKLYTDAFADPCVVSADPVEKTPLHHFLPGKRFMTVATAGCNLRCAYCQNASNSQRSPLGTTNLQLSPPAAALKARQSGLAGIALSYTEPVAFMEYALALAGRARSLGLKTVVATAAQVNPAPLAELCRAVDGFAVTLKGFSQKFYHRVCSGHLRPVLQSLEAIRRSGRWLEVVVLLVPTLNDGPAELKRLSQWMVRHLGRDVPLHFTRFFPHYRLGKFRQTPVDTLSRARDIARSEGVRYVYVGNLHGHPGNSTYCAGCGSRQIRRMGFSLLDNRVASGRCSRCRKPIPGVWR